MGLITPFVAFSIKALAKVVGIVASSPARLSGAVTVMMLYKRASSIVATSRTPLVTTRLFLLFHYRMYQLAMWWRRERLLKKYKRDKLAYELQEEKWQIIDASHGGLLVDCEV